MAGELRRLLDPGDWLAIKPRLDPQATALEINHSPGLAEIKLRIWVGLAVLALVSAVVYFFADDGFVVFVACGFGFFGLLNLIYGVIQSGFSMSLVITDFEVVVDVKNLWGRKKWRERLKNYRGVLLHEEHLREAGVDDMAMTKRYHVIELAHDDARKTVPLYVKEGGAPPREIQNAFANRFGLPALVPDSSGEIARSAGGLLGSVSRRNPPIADPGPPPSGVLLKEQGDTTRLTMVPSRLNKGMVWLFWLSFPLLVGGLVYQLDPVMGYATTGMTALFVLLMLGLGKLMGGDKEKSRQALCISRERVWIDSPERRNNAMVRLAALIVGRMAGIDLTAASPSRSSLPRSAIEQVRVDTYTSYSQVGDTGDGLPAAINHPRLIIEGDTGTLEFIGAQFDRKRLEWVRDYLRHRLTHHA
jgi:hypothetical protein